MQSQQQTLTSPYGVETTVRLSAPIRDEADFSGRSTLSVYTGAAYVQSYITAQECRDLANKLRVVADALEAADSTLKVAA